MIPLPTQARFLGLAAFAFALGGVHDASAQDAAPAAPPAADPPPEAAEPAPAAAPPATAPPALPALPPVPSGPALPAILPRATPLATTLGMDPVQPDFGAEADMVSTVSKKSLALPPKKWNRKVNGFFRAPMKVGLGPRNDGTDGGELHSPPRVVGRTQDEWSYVGLTPSPTAQLHVSAENQNVKGTLVLAATTFFDTGYSNLDEMGGVSQAYITLRSPNLFGNKGGLAWNVGSFSNRYGGAGPNQESTGYYGTHLFGRTHVAGYSVTADYDASDKVRILVEQGFGTKLEVVPWVPLSENPPTAEYLPEQGPVPQGSNFLHHAHAAVVLSETVTIGAHHLISYSPNDRGPVGVEADPAQMTIMGGEVRVDHDLAGHAFLGYSRVDAVDILPLSNAVQVLHGGNGVGFAENYFPASETDPTVPQDSGIVDTVAGQYMLHLRPLLGHKEPGPDVAVAVYGMFNHIWTPTDFTQDRLKVGGELQFMPIKQLSIGARYDQVIPDLSSNDASYSAISPRIIIHTDFMSREYIIINYSHYFLGDEAFPSEPYNNLAQADPDLITLSAIVSF